MKRNRTKKSILVSVMSLLLSISMFAGSTYAWFTDEVSSGVNRIIAGNLDVEMYYKNPNHTEWTDVATTSSTDPMFFVDKDGQEILWEPGVVSYANFEVKNVGNLALKYKFALTYAQNYLANHGLSEVVKAAVVDGTVAYTSRSEVEAISESEFKTLDNFKIDNAELEPGEYDDFTVVLYWVPNANNVDNLYNANNGQTVSDYVVTEDNNYLWLKMDINLVATQYTYESDSFDDQYDANALLANLPQQQESVYASGNVNSDGETIIKDEFNDTIATIPTSSGNALTGTVDGNDGVSLNAADGENVTLNLNVQFTDQTQTSVTYEISMTATGTNTDNVVMSSAQVTEISKPITITKDIGVGLTEVTVLHSGNEMHDNGSATFNESDLDTYTSGLYYYNPSTGVLYIYTKTFSPFKVSFKVNNDFVARIGNVGFTSLKEAIDNALPSDVIDIVSDCSISSSDFVDSKIEYRTNGKTITVDGNRQIKNSGNMVGLKYFSGGSGTEEQPFFVDNLTDMSNVGRNSGIGWLGGYTYSLTSDLQINNKDIVGHSISSGGHYDIAKYMDDGTIFYGNNHTITVNTDDLYIFHGPEGNNSKHAILKDLNVVLNGTNLGLCAYAKNCTIENINISGNVIWTDDNLGLVAATVYDDLSITQTITLRNIVNNCNISVNGGATLYDGLFIGNIKQQKTGVNAPTIEYIDCINNANVSGQRISLFVGNPWGTGDLKIVTSNVINNGVFRAMNSDESYYANIYYAVPSNLGDSNRDIYINGTAYKCNQVPTLDTDDDNIINLGIITKTPVDENLSLTVNQDKSLSLTPSNNSSISKYVVYLGLYTTVYNADGSINGSNRFYVSETINASELNNGVSLMNYGFIDQVWLNNHPGAVEGSLAGNCIYTLGSDSYYLISDSYYEGHAGYGLGGNVRYATMISVVAYDSNDNVICTALAN